LQSADASRKTIAALRLLVTAAIGATVGVFADYAIYAVSASMSFVVWLSDVRLDPGDAFLLSDVRLVSLSNGVHPLLAAFLHRSSWIFLKDIWVLGLVATVHWKCCSL